MTEDWTRNPQSARRIKERSGLSTAAIHSSGPAAKLLKFYEYHENERLTCPLCRWSGQAHEAPQELHRELFDVSCPACNKMLLVVSWPTTEETRRAAAAGDERAHRQMPQVEQIEARWARARNSPEAGQRSS